MNEKTRNICRICLKQIFENSNLYFLSNSDDLMLKHKLLDFVPHMDLSYPLNPVICTPCTSMIETIYNFKVLCLQTEATVKSLRSHDMPLDSVLNAVSPVKIEEICVKEEMVEERSIMGEINNSDLKLDIEEQTADLFYCYSCIYSTGDKRKLIKHSRIHQRQTKTSPPETQDIAKTATLRLLPEKSKKKYEKQHELFVSWCCSNSIKRFSENALIAYFSEKANVNKAPTLWSIYSMLKTTLGFKNRVDISGYKRLISFLKRQSVGYKSKTSKVFTKEEINKFLREAPDQLYLMKKVLLIIGVAGACKRDELVNMSISDVEDKETVLIIKIPVTKTNQNRVFTVTNSIDENGTNYLSTYRKYVNLRPKETTNTQFFLQYRNGLCVNQNVAKDTDGVVNKLMPRKSQNVYEKELKKFENWCSENQVEEVAESVLLTYFETQGKINKSSTLWTKYSMLRTMLIIRKNLDISQFVKVLALLRRFSEGYRPKKCNILQSEDIDKFVSEAPDEIYLGLKVVLIMGYSGACSRIELTNMLIEDLEYRDDTIVVTVSAIEKNVPRIFAVTNIRWINVIKTYADCRAANTKHRRFLVTYTNGRCITQPMGKNKIGQVPRIIATYLQLPNPELFSGHCFRRSSITHRRGDIVNFKRHRGWKTRL